ncbi:MAG: endonuclease domain-containing protein [Oscillospiraceae bacterium]|nr:endonuclease domain-containing protein [Oscillospiraceae bacterium]
MFHPRNDKLLPLARQLRKEMTMEERILWFEYLRAYPVRFRRQEIIGNYIADFYCSKAKLVIELDGSQHYEDGQKLKDAIRTERLREYNLTVIRIPNNEIHSNLRGVCEYIDMVVQDSLKKRENVF